MNDGHPAGEVRPVIVRDVLNATGTQGASLRTRLWAASPGRSGLSDACITRRGNARVFCTYFTVAYFRTLKRPPQPFGPGNSPVT